MSEQITYTTEQIMEQAQVFASAWSLVGGCFDSGDQLEVAEQEKAELASMVTAHSAPQATDLPCEFAPEFRRALLWLLWHHQGGKSPVGQPIRAMLGIGQHDYLTDSELAEAKAYREHSLLWAVHAQGPDELWAAESREEAEHHAAALNALPGQTDTIKVNAVVIPSPWSEVEHWKTLAEQWRNEAEDRIASLQSTRAALENVTKVARGNLELLDENTALRGRAADLLHLLQYATITTPSSGDAEQAMIAMGDLSRMISAPSDTSAVSLEAHRDNTAVDRFASAMKSKLSEGRAAGRYGWHDPKLCSDLHIARMLIEHLPKGNAGNFEDIANLSMMLHQRGADPAVLAKAAAQKPDPAVVVRVVHRDGEVLDPEVLATSAAFDSLPHDTRVALYAIADAAIDDKEAADA